MNIKNMPNRHHWRVLALSICKNLSEKDSILPVLNKKSWTVWMRIAFELNSLWIIFRGWKVKKRNNGNNNNCFSKPMKENSMFTLCIVDEEQCWSCFFFVMVRLFHFLANWMAMLQEIHPFIVMRNIASMQATNAKHAHSCVTAAPTKTSNDTKKK